MYKCTASPFTLLYIMQALCAIYHLYLCTFTHVYVLFAVWSSAPVHKDWQTNALTPSICSMVTSLMLWTLLVLQSPVAVLRVLSAYTQYTQVSVWTPVCTFINTCNFIRKCVQYKIIHVHMSIVTTFACSKCTYYYSFVKKTRCVPPHGYISILNDSANLFWHMPVCGSYVAGPVVFTQHAYHLHCMDYLYTMHHNTNSTHFDTIAAHTYSIYDPLIQCFCWTQHTYVPNIRIDLSTEGELTVEMNKARGIITMTQTTCCICSFMTVPLESHALFCMCFLVCWVWDTEQFKVHMVGSPHLWLSCWHPVLAYTTIHVIALQWSPT